EVPETGVAAVGGAVETILSWAWLAIAAWLIVRAFNQRGLLEPVAVKPPPPAKRAPAIAVIVPARNEAGNIGACLKSLIGQDYPPSRLSIIVVDDHSGDATPAIVVALRKPIRRCVCCARRRCP